jgi:hypothetical protein
MGGATGACRKGWPEPSAAKGAAPKRRRGGQPGNSTTAGAAAYKAAAAVWETPDTEEKRRRRVKESEWDALWPALEGAGWSVESGSRPRDFFWLPPGVNRGDPAAKVRVHYFDSRSTVLSFVKESAEWSAFAKGRGFTFAKGDPAPPRRRRVVSDAPKQAAGPCAEPPFAKYDDLLARDGVDYYRAVVLRVREAKPSRAATHLCHYYGWNKRYDRWLGPADIFPLSAAAELNVVELDETGRRVVRPGDVDVEELELDYDEVEEVQAEEEEAEEKDWPSVYAAYSKEQLAQHAPSSAPQVAAWLGALCRAKVGPRRLLAASRLVAPLGWLPDKVC